MSVSRGWSHRPMNDGGPVTARQAEGPVNFPALGSREIQAALSAPFDLGDFISLGAAGGDDFDRRAFLLADQRARQWRGNGDAALLGIGFRLADDLPHRFLV